MVGVIFVYNTLFGLYGYSFLCLVGCFSMIIWTPAVLRVLSACVLYFCICTCSAQLSIFHVERHSRNTLIIITIIINQRQQGSDSDLQDGAPVQAGAAHVHHAIARHCGWGGVVDVVRLKDDLAVGRHGDAISVGQSQGLVVVQHRVQVFNPDGIYWSIQHQPDVFSWKCIYMMLQLPGILPRESDHLSMVCIHRKTYHLIYCFTWC